MIVRNAKNLESRYYGTKKIVAVYRGKRLIWELANDSCFGNGYWMRDKPWIKTDGWRKNK